jgi:hypothetical protein
MIDADASIGYIPSSILRDLGVGDKKIVLVPFSRLPMPCAGLPISLAKEWAQSSLGFGLLIRCRYSIVAPVSGSMMEHAQCSVLVVIFGRNTLSTFSSWLLVIIVVTRLVMCSRGMRCRLGYRGSSSIRVGGTLGDLRLGLGVATIGGGWGSSRLIHVLFLGGPVASGSMT